MFIKNVSTVFIVQITTALLSISTNLFLAWQLSPAEKGLIFVLVTNPNLAVIIINLGIPIAGTYIAAKNKYPIHDLVFNVLLILFCVGVLFFLVSYYFFYIFAEYLYFEIPNNYVVLSFSTIPFCLLTSCMSDIFWGLKKKAFFILTRITVPILFLTLAIFLVGGVNYGLEGAIWAYTISYYIGGGVVFFLSLQIIGFTAKVQLPIMKELLEYGLKAHLARTCQQIIYRIDIPLLNYFGEFQNLGYYSIAVPLAELVWNIPSAMSYVLLSTVAQTADKYNEDLTIKVIKHSLFISIISTFFVLGGTVCIVMFIPNYYPTIILTLILLFGTISATIFQILFNYWFGKGKPHIVLFISLAGLVIALGLYSILIPQLNERGAALASVIIYIFQSLFALIIWAIKEKVSLKKIFSWQVNDFNLYLKLLGKIFPDSFIKNKP